MLPAVLVAFDKFKDALTAEAACAIAATALPTALPRTLRPLTDGGEGFVTALLTALGADVLHHPVSGPLGYPVNAIWGTVAWSALPPAAQAMLDLPAPATTSPAARIAFVEAASTCGLMQVPPARRDPAKTTSAGLGQLLHHVTQQPGVAAIVIGLGGSATNDLGLGLLSELGLTCHDTTGHAISPPLPGRWPEISHLRGELRPSLPLLRIACDVTNPLLGQRGASAVFGPQKGLALADVAPADESMARLAGLLAAYLNLDPSRFAEPGAGAAGGIAAGLLATGRAQLLPGFDFVSACLALDDALDRCSIVLTGEGRFDASSLEGKGPGSLVRTALTRGKRVLVIAGAVDSANLPAGIHAIALSPPDLPLPQALAETAERLERAVRAAFAPGGRLSTETLT